MSSARGSTLLFSLIEELWDLRVRLRLERVDCFVILVTHVVDDGIRFERSIGRWEEVILVLSVVCWLL